MRSAFNLLFITVLLVFSPSLLIHADTEEESAFADCRFYVTMQDSLQRLARIDFAGIAVIPGTLQANIRLHQNAIDYGLAIIGNSKENSILTVSGGEVIQLTWLVRLPEKGPEYLQLLCLKLSMKPLHSRNPEHKRLNELFPLYVELRNGIAVNYDVKPDVRFSVPPVEIFAKKNVEGGAAIQSSAFPFIFTITGRITAENPDNSVMYGVPGVRVYFDWDTDNNAGTYLHPDYLGGTSYTETDESGNYTFTRALMHTDPNSYIYDPVTIRIFAKCSNDATYSGDLGENANFVDQAKMPILITIYDQNYSMTAPDLVVDALQGNALRHLHRARRFSIDQFGFAPPKIKFRDETNSSGAGGTFKRDCAEGNPFSNDPCIVFRTVPYPLTGYHEYGHFTHWSFNPDKYPGGFGCPSPHDWDEISNDRCAFVEGWAEFYAAATYMYWINLENPALRESERGNGSIENALHFPDAGQGELVQSTNNLEGMVATFIYGLWDDIRLRTDQSSPDYLGDNEDLGFPCGYPARQILTTTSEIYKWNYEHYEYVDMAEAYRRAFQEATNKIYPVSYPYHQRSINAYYNALSSDDPPRQHPATPTELTINEISPIPPATQKLRQLVWNDNSEPSSIAYSSNGNGATSIDLVENNEDGYMIWRKKWDRIPDDRPVNPLCEHYEIVDGRLDGGYTLIAVTGQDITSYTDATVLPEGYYSYVVVSFTDAGQSGTFNTTTNVPIHIAIPKVEEFIFVAAPQIIIKRDKFFDGPLCKLPHLAKPGTSERYFLEPIPGQSPDTDIKWIATNQPPFVSLSNIESDTVTVVNMYIPGLPVTSFAPFSLRCVITNNGASDTSLPIFPALYPFDSLTTFVSISDTLQSFTQEKHNLRGLDFMIKPDEQVHSLRTLGFPQPLSWKEFGNKVLVTGLPEGTLYLDKSCLLSLHHPNETELAGSAECGFDVYFNDSGSYIQDNRFAYGFKEMPIQVAHHSRFGNVTSKLSELDMMDVELEPTDSLWITFKESSVGDADTIYTSDTTFFLDTTRSHWITDFVLELVGTFHYDQGVGSSISNVRSFSASDERGSMLNQILPNPASTSTVLFYSVQTEGTIRIELFDVQGRQVRAITDGFHKTGIYSIRHDIIDLVPGTYYYHMTVGTVTQSLPLIIVR